MMLNRASRLILVLLVALASPVGASDAASVDEQDRDPALGDFQSKSLPAAEVAALRRSVLIQCGLDNSRNVLPWYFHFEYGQALLEAGDARRAVVELSRSIDLRPEPRANKRTYGMWFIDYLPYFQLAEAHAKLDNWPCAEHAMQMSQSMGEAETGRIEPQRIRALQERIDHHVGEVGSCNLRDVLDGKGTKEWGDS